MGGATAVVIVLRTTDDVLRWAGRLVDPPLRTAIGRLPEPSREVAELQLGWHHRTWGGEDAPAASIRSALTLVCADAVGGDPHDAVPSAVAVELLHHWSAIRRDLVDEHPDGTAWSVVGAEPASLGGEALLALAFDVIATGDPTHSSPARPRQRPGRPGADRAMLRILGDAVQELLHGQHASLALRDTPPLARTQPSTADRRPARDCSEAGHTRAGLAADRRPARDSSEAGHTRAGLAADQRPARDSSEAGRTRAGLAADSPAVSADRHEADDTGAASHPQRRTADEDGAGNARGRAVDAGRGPVGGEERTDLLRDCLAMVEQRTGALFGAACALGAVAGGGDPAQVERLRLFGVRLGLAVQFTEDLLGIWGERGGIGPDLRRRRRSLPVAAAIAAGADELAALFEGRARLSDADVERAAKTIEQSGAREWCRRQAEELLSQALLALDLASPSPTAVAELVALARRATATPR
ncbi:polyprenyl synthetase family protein [Dactylosporangium sp. CA-139114]|uniref:polyprenyl synthetase family protein n=1 Tax=Dactylosporangium sp. CA-139114 TaxID=3239931 RepID=UPI003D97C565